MIKFRAFTNNMEMVIGNLSILTKKYLDLQPGWYISNESGAPFAFDVKPETVGQFTGLLDRDGKEIYSGDIVQIVKKARKTNHIIMFSKGSFAIQPPCMNYIHLNEFTSSKKLKVTGNIHQNPELLKGIAFLNHLGEKYYLTDEDIYADDWEVVGGEKTH